MNIAGHYALTYTAASTCSQLPDDMRTRTYAATLEPVAIEGRPSNTLFKVITTGALFVPRLAFDYFLIGVAGDYLSLLMGDLHGRPGLVEQVLPTTYVALGAKPQVLWNQTYPRSAFRSTASSTTASRSRRWSNTLTSAPHRTRWSRTPGASPRIIESP